MRTKHYRSFFIIRGIVVEDEGYHEVLRSSLRREDW